MNRFGNARRLLVAVAVLAALPQPRAGAQRAESVLRAAYTAEQAQAGLMVYRAACSECHLESLRGRFEAPELAGPNFRVQWADVPVSGLLDYVRETMPVAEPASLSDQEYAAVVAYMLRENGVLPGTTPLAFSPDGGFGRGRPGPGIRAAGEQRGRESGPLRRARPPASSRPPGGALPGAGVIPPVPGRPGTGPSSHAVDRAPEEGRRGSGNANGRHAEVPSP